MKRSESKTLLAIGECMVEMAALGDGTFRQGFAGDTFNTAWHARRMLGTGWTVNYFTAVGDDPVSTRMIAFMEQSGIGTAHIAKRKGRAPGLYMIELDQGERSFTYWRDTSAAKTLADDEETLRRAVDQADAIYFSGITLAILSAEARARLIRVLASAKARGAMVAFDSNIRKHLWSSPDEMNEAITSATRVITLALPTLPDEPEAPERYIAARVPEIALKAGSRPARLIWPGGDTMVPAQPVARIVDTTGAGDSFNAAYIAARLSGKEPPHAAAQAHATAARVIQSHGALV